ncbi:MAG: GNAT family N-acetyltransferase [Clostridiales bacterium]|nr:GNAT family N-acetyltransferase [Clostridiales bacterium]
MIRLAREGDTPQIRDLWSYCFDDSPEFIDFFFNTCYLPGNTLIAEEGDRIQSSLQLLPYRMQLRGREVPVYYIVGVGTWPEYRGQGLVKKLLLYADNVMKERGYDISILLPFQYDFYRKYGWEVCYDLLIYREVISNSVIAAPKQQIKAGTGGSFRKVNLNVDLNKLTDCYFNYMNGYNGYILRGPNEWAKLIKDLEMDNGFAYAYEFNNETQGYILYAIEDKTLAIQELIYTTATSKHNLLNLALSHMGQVDNIIRKAPIWDTDYLSMLDSRGKLEKETFVMGRIHRMIGAIGGLDYIGDPFVLQVKDDFYHDNNGCYEIKQRNGKAKVSRVIEEPDITINIQCLSQLLWGYLSVENAYRENRLSCSKEESLQNLMKLFPHMYNYMTEVY